MKRILVFAAHPDDEVLGCGGTINRLTQEGNEVYIAILGEGITSRYKEPAQADPQLKDALHNRSHRAAELLGATELFLFNLPDNRFDTVPLLDLIKIIEDMVARLQPGIIYTHHAGDLNIDHVIVHRAVLTATRPQSNQAVKEIYAFEVPSSTDWAFDQFARFTPNIFVDISNSIKTKIEAMALYEGEIRPYPHPRSAMALEALARKWGSAAGLVAAEAFQLIRLIQ